MEQVVLDELIERPRPRRVLCVQSGLALPSSDDRGRIRIERQLMFDLTVESGLAQVRLKVNNLAEIDFVFVSLDDLALPLRSRCELKARGGAAGREGRSARQEIRQLTRSLRSRSGSSGNQNLTETRDKTEEGTHKVASDIVLEWELSKVGLDHLSGRP